MKNPLPRDCQAKYRFEGQLAAGGFGLVCRAQQLSLDRPVAIKILHAELCADDTQRQRFLHEARITASLQSQHIVRILDEGISEGIPWLVFELINGCSLRQLLAAGAMSPDAALIATLHTARALEVAHAGNVLHRDIKPENILQAGPDLYKLTDFGIARWNVSGRVATQYGMVLGTPGYLPPEQLSGAEPTAAGDYYALGATLFELLTGTLPFASESLADIFNRQLTERPPPPSSIAPGLSPDIDHLVLNMLEPDPIRRAGDVNGFIQDLETLLLRRGIRHSTGGQQNAPFPPATGATMDVGHDTRIVPLTAGERSGVERIARTARIAVPRPATAGHAPGRWAAMALIAFALTAMGAYWFRHRGPRESDEVLAYWSETRGLERGAALHVMCAGNRDAFELKRIINEEEALLDKLERSRSLVDLVPEGAGTPLARESVGAALACAAASCALRLRLAHDLLPTTAQTQGDTTVLTRAATADAVSADRMRIDCATRWIVAYAAQCHSLSAPLDASPVLELMELSRELSDLATLPEDGTKLSTEAVVLHDRLASLAPGPVRTVILVVWELPPGTLKYADEARICSSVGYTANWAASQDAWKGLHRDLCATAYLLAVLNCDTVTDFTSRFACVKFMTTAMLTDCEQSLTRLVHIRQELKDLLKLLPQDPDAEGLVWRSRCVMDLVFSQLTTLRVEWTLGFLRKGQPVPDSGEPPASPELIELVAQFCACTTRCIARFPEMEKTLIDQNYVSEFYRVSAWLACPYRALNPQNDPGDIGKALEKAFLIFRTPREQENAAFLLQLYRSGCTRGQWDSVHPGHIPPILKRLVSLRRGKRADVSFVDDLIETYINWVIPSLATEMDNASHVMERYAPNILDSEWNTAAESRMRPVDKDGGAAAEALTETIHLLQKDHFGLARQRHLARASMMQLRTWLRSNARLAFTNRSLDRHLPREGLHYLFMAIQEVQGYIAAAEVAATHGEAETLTPNSIVDDLRHLAGEVAAVLLYFDAGTAYKSLVDEFVEDLKKRSATTSTGLPIAASVNWRAGFGHGLWKQSAADTKIICDTYRRLQSLPTGAGANFEAWLAALRAEEPTFRCP